MPPAVCSLPKRTLSEKIYRYFYERRRRRWLDVQRLEGSFGCRIISVGNITTGATGKTPAVQWLAGALASTGTKVAIVARGYGGAASATGAVVSNGAGPVLSAVQGGDEPVLHARSLPTIPVLIGRNREVAVRRAIEEYDANLIVLDDAFQYWSLPRDFDLVLLDARHPFHNGHLLPRGRLRESPSALERADAILLTRCDQASDDHLECARRQIEQWSGAPIFHSCHQPMALRDETTGELLPLDMLKGCRIAAFSALADNRSFLQTIEPYGVEIAFTIARHDHHRWSEREISRIVQRANSNGAGALLTTEKDAVKILPQWMKGLPLWSLVIKLKVEHGDALLSIMRNKIYKQSM